MKIKESNQTFSINMDECSKNDLNLFKSFKEAMKIHCLANSELICELQMGSGKAKCFSHEKFLAGNNGQPHWVDMFTLRLPEEYGGSMYKIEPGEKNSYFVLSDYGEGRWNIIETEDGIFQFQPIK